MQTAATLSVFSDFTCKAGTRVAYLQAPLSAREKRAVRSEEELSGSIAIGDAAYAHLTPRRALRVSYPGETTFDEWRIDKITERRDANGKILVDFRCLPPLYDLGAVGLLQRTEADGSVAFEYDLLQLTPAEILAQIVTAHPDLSWVGIGTIDVSTPVDLTISWDTPLSALRRLAEITDCELQLRRNGTTNYLLDLVTEIGSGAAPLDCQYGKNLISALRERSTAELATRVYGKGAPLDDGIHSTLKDNRWVAGAPSGSNVVLTDPAGGDGPILVDDQLNGLYLDKLDGTTPTQITDSIASSQTVTVASVAGITAGMLVRICKDAAGAPVTYLEHPIYKQNPPTGYGLKVGICERPDIAGAVNLVKNASLRAYAGASAAPDTWVKLGSPTLTRTNNAARWLTGGFSCRIQGTADGEGIETEYVTLQPTAALPYFSGYMVYWVDAGTLRVELIPAKAEASVTSITRSGTTVTVTTSGAHGLQAGQLAEITGAVETDYNGIKAVSTVPTSTTWTFEIATTPTTPATGTIKWAQVWRLPGYGDKPASSGGTKSWDQVGVGGQDLNALAAVRAKLRVVQHGSTALDAYIDAGMLTQTPAFEEFVDGAGPTRLWQATNLKLDAACQPAERYENAILDVQAIDPQIWTFETITLGQAVNLKDETLGITRTVRLLEYERNLLTLEVMPTVLGTEFPSFTRKLLPIRLPRRRTPSGQVDPQLIAAAYFDEVPDTPGIVRVTLGANVPGATPYYWLGDIHEQPPNTGLIQAGAPSATMWGTYTQPFTVSQDQVKDLQMAVFVRLGTRLSPVAPYTIDRDSRPRLTSMSAVELTGIKPQYSWVPDDDVRRVRLFHKVGSWPVDELAITSITCSGTTATVTTATAHHLRTGDLASISGAVQADYNGDKTVTVTSATQFTFTVSGSPATPATGSISMKSCRQPLVELNNFIAEMAVSPDGGGRLANGTTWTGGTTYATTTGLTNGDQVYAIAVPIDYRGNAGIPEDRAGVKITMSAAPTPAILSMTVVRTNDGSACDTTNGAEFTFTWTQQDLVDGTHKVRVIADVYTTLDTTPVASTSATVRVPYYKSSNKFAADITIPLTWELLDGSDVVIQSGSASPSSDTFKNECPI